MPIDQSSSKSEKEPVYFPVASGLSCFAKGNSPSPKVCQRSRFVSNAGAPQERPTAQASAQDLDRELWSVVRRSIALIILVLVRRSQLKSSEHGTLVSSL
jgi:hypothetical protein